MNRCIACWVAFSLALAGLAVAAPPAAAGAGSEDVFVDRFEVGVTGVLVDGVARYFRRAGEVVVPVECGVAYDMLIEATPLAEPWTFDFAPVAEGMTPNDDGFSYLLDCGFLAEDGQVTATSGGVEDSTWLRFLEGPKILGLDLNDDGEVDIAVAGGVFEAPYNVVCGFTSPANIIANTPDLSLINAPEGMSLNGDQLTTRLLCSEDTLEQTVVQATKNELPNQAQLDIQGTLAYIDHIQLNGNQYDNVEGVIGPIIISCEDAFSGQYRPNILDNWDYEAVIELPTGATLTPEGLLQYQPSCDLGSPEQISTVTRATQLDIPSGEEVSTSDVETIIEITGVAQPTNPELYGLELHNSGNNDNPVSGGLFSSPLELVCGFGDSSTTSVRVLGDADSYSLSNNPSWMSINGDDISYLVPGCSEDFSDTTDVNAHRDSLIDSAVLTINATKPLIERLTVGGNDYFVVGDEFEPVTVACGEETTGSYHTNVLDEWSFSQASQVPDGFTLNPDGTFAYTPSCAPGSPEQTQYAKEATKEGVTLDSIISNFTITGVEQGGPGPVVDGLIGADGTIDYFVFNDNGTFFIDPIEYMCGRERQLEIVGDADSYELINAPDFMTINNNLITYHPDWDEPACNDSPNGLESQLTIRAHKNGQTKDVEKTAYAMNPRIDCVTHYPGIPAGGGTAPDPIEYCDTNGSGAIDDIIPLTYNIETPHNIQIHARPSLENYTPAISYSHDGQNIPSFMGLDSITGNINANPNSSQAGFYFTTVKASNGGKETGWKGVNYEVVE